MQRKSHLTIEGLRKIVAIKAGMNRGLSDVNQKAFPQVVRVTRPKVQNKKISDVYLLAGFTSAQGYFMIKVIENKKLKTGFQIKLKFIITQHVRHEQLMKSLIKYFECGYTDKDKTRPNVVNFIVTIIADIHSKDYSVF